MYAPGSASGPSGNAGVEPGLPLNAKVCANAGGGSYLRSHVARLSPTFTGSALGGSSQKLSIGGRAASRTDVVGELVRWRTTLPLASRTSTAMWADALTARESYKIAPSGGYGAFGPS